MSGLSTAEMAKAMKEIGMGKNARNCSLNLKDPVKLKEFEQLEKEIKSIGKKGMVHLASEWLGES